jgi:hypothetical protein
VGEVLIAGSGVAAIACALRLLQLGFRPVIIASEAEIPPGAEVIPQPVLPLLRQLGLAEALTRAGAEHRSGFENHLDAEHPALLSGSWTHFERGDFLRFALAEALARGVRLQHSRDFHAVVERADAPVVVDATGRSAILSQPTAQHGSEVASVFRIPGCATACARAFRAASHWCYAIPFAGHTTLGVVGSPVERIPTSVWDSLPMNAAAVRIARRPAFAQRSLQAVRSRRIAIGDAAMAYNPLAGHGIRFALQSALAAAAVIRTWRDAPADSAVAEQYYQEFVTAAWRRHVAFLTDRTPPANVGAAGPIRFTAPTRVTGIQRDARIVSEEAVQLPDGGLVRWVGGVDLLHLRTLAADPILPPELIARLSVLGLNSAQASRFVEWCIHRGVLG